MAVHRLTTPSPPTSPRRSPRLGLHSRKRARPSDSDLQLTPSSSKLPPTPNPSPRWIRANKRQKVLDTSSLASPSPTTSPIANGTTRAGKRKSLTPPDHRKLDSHHVVARKKRKENIVNDAPTANATTSLKINVTLDTRQGVANNNTGQSQSLMVTRNTRSMTRNMKNPSPDEARVDSSPPPDSATRSYVFTHGSKSISVPSSTIPSPSVISQAIDTKSDIPTYDVAPTATTIFSGAITNDAQLSSHDSIQSSTTSSCSSSDIIPPPLSKSPLEISTPLIMPLPISISSLPMSFMNVPLSMPLNLAFMNMPLSIPLNIPISTDISTTLAPSESELGFGFQPQEEFSSSTGREEGQDKGDHEDGKGEHVFPQQLSTPPLLTPARPTTNESTPSRSSPDLFLDCPPSPPPQSCTPCLNPSSTTPTRIPPRLAISTCLSDQPPPTSTSTTSPTSYSLNPSFINSTSPTHSSPLKVICFPSFPVPQQQHERRMKDWAMDVADDPQQTERTLEHEMSMELSLPFRNSSPGQGDELRLGQQALEEERSPSLSPVPQPSSQPLDPYPQLAPPFPPCPPSPACCSSSSSGAPTSSSRQYHKKVEYQHHQIPEWTPKLDKERNLWKLACKIRVWEITKRYTPDTIRTVVAQEAHDYYSVHGFPLGYGSVPARSRKRRWRKSKGGAGSSTTAAAGSDSSSMMDSTPSLSPPSPRDDEFMNEETYSFELMDDDDDMDGSVSGGAGFAGGLRSMEDEWRYEGFEDDEFEEEEDDDDEDEDYDDLSEDDDDDDLDEVVEGDVDRTKTTGNRKKKGNVSFIAGEDQDQDPDAEGEMEIDIEPFQDPSFNAELSSPTSPTSPSTTSNLKSKSKSDSGVDDEPKSFVSSFYIPPVPPHVQHIMQMQQQEEEEAPAALAPSPLDSSTNPLSPATSEGTPISTFDTVDHGTATIPNNESNHTPMQIHLPPAPHHPHHYHSQLIQFSSNILPLPPPRLDSVRVFILRQSEMGGLKTTGRGTPADRKRGAIWCGDQIRGRGGRQEAGTNGNNKRGFDDGNESESDEEENGGEDDDEGRKRGRPRLRLMLSDHDIDTGPRRGSGEGEGGDGAKTSLRHKPSSSSTFVATDQTWDAFMASLDDKNYHHQPPQQQGEVGTLDSSVSAADSDTIITHGQLLVDLDGHLLSNQHRLHREGDFPPSAPLATTTTTTCRLGPSLSPTSSIEGSSGMFMFNHQGQDDDDDDDSTSTWFEDESGGLGGGGRRRRRRSSGSGLVVVGSSSGTCPSDALAMEGFNFPVGPDGSSTLSYALG